MTLGEQYTPGDIEPPPRLVARTTGAGGGWVEAPDGTTTEWNAAPLPGPPVDTYGAGDCFAAGLTYGLAEGRTAYGSRRDRRPVWGGVRDGPRAVQASAQGRRLTPPVKPETRPAPSALSLRDGAAAEGSSAVGAAPGPRRATAR